MKSYVDEIVNVRKEKVKIENQIKKDVNEFLDLTKNIDAEIFASNFVKFRIDKELLIEKGYVDIKLWDFNIASSDGNVNDNVEEIDRIFNIIRNKDDLVRIINSNAERVVGIEMRTTGNYIKYLDSHIKTYLYPVIKPFLEEWGFNIEENLNAINDVTYLKLTLKDTE